MMAAMWPRPYGHLWVGASRNERGSSMSVPKCPHCNVGMWLYETVQKADGPYGRYECRISHCSTCNGRCTHKEGKTID